MNQKSTLIGIIIDVSASMKKNWKTPDKRSIPKIEVISEVLNHYLNKLKTLSNQRDINFFCIGMGIKNRLKQGLYEVEGVEEEIKKRIAEVEIPLMDLIIDFISLQKILPNQEQIGDLKNRIHNLWIEYANEIMDGTRPNLYAKDMLLEVFNKEFYEKTLNGKRHGFYLRIERTRGKYVKKILLTIQSLFQIGLSEAEVQRYSENISYKFINTIEKHALDIFSNHREKYKELIKSNIEGFARDEIKNILERQVIGFSNEEIIEAFSKEKMLDLQNKVYVELKKDIKKEFSYVWSSEKLRLIWSKMKLSYQVYLETDLKAITESFIYLIAQEEIEANIEKSVNSIFEQAFQQELKNIFPSWIDFATRFHSTSKMQSFDNFLPKEEDSFFLYSNDFMFSNFTPFYKAIQYASLHLLDNKYVNQDKYLIVVSDGDFEDNGKIDESIVMLKNRGVKLIGILVAEQDYISQVGYFMKSANKEVKNFASLCSKINDTKKLREFVKENRLLIPDGNRLCFQLNHSKSIEAILDFIFDFENET